MNRVIAAIGLVLVAGSAASAQLTHYFTQGDRLFVTSNNGVTVTQINMTLNGSTAPTISSLAFDPMGNLWGGTTAGGNLYRINTTTGALTSTAIPALGGQTNTFDFRMNGSVLELLTFTTFTGGRTDFQIRNANTGAVISAATTVLTGVNPGIPASAYPGSGNTMYALDGLSYNLRALNLSAISTPTVIGNTGITWSQAGGAWHNGQMWLGTRIGAYNTSTGQQNHGTSGFRFGTINTTTGAFTQVFTVSERPFGGGFGYAVIPTPASAALLGLAGIAAARRRR